MLVHTFSHIALHSACQSSPCGKVSLFDWWLVNLNTHHSTPTHATTIYRLWRLKQSCNHSNWDEARWCAPSISARNRCYRRGQWQQLWRLLLRLTGWTGISKWQRLYWVFRRIRHHFQGGHVITRFLSPCHRRSHSPHTLANLLFISVNHPCPWLGILHLLLFPNHIFRLFCALLLTLNKVWHL